MKLTDTTDAMMWAEEFCRIFTNYLIVPVNIVVAEDPENTKVIGPGTMVGWFANAIETGRSAGLEKSAGALADDLADVLSHMVVGWEKQTGIDLAEHPEVQRVMARYRTVRG